MKRIALAFVLSFSLFLAPVGFEGPIRMLLRYFHGPLPWWHLLFCYSLLQLLLGVLIYFLLKTKKYLLLIPILICIVPGACLYAFTDLYLWFERLSYRISSP